MQENAARLMGRALTEEEKQLLAKAAAEAREKLGPLFPPGVLAGLAAGFSLPSSSSSAAPDPVQQQIIEQENRLQELRRK